MHLSFHKEEDNIIVRIVAGKKIIEFSYLDFVERLFSGEPLDESEYDLSISPAEREAVQRMVEAINVAVQEVITSPIEEMCQADSPQEKESAPTTTEEVPF